MDISIIMIVKNGQKYILEALQSIKKQTFKNYEVVIVNDGSTDNTLAIINQFKEHNPKIQIEVSTNLFSVGIAESRNIGINLSKGKYISWLDHDDIYYPEKLQSQFNFLEKNQEYAMVGTNVDLIDSKSENIGEISYGKTPDEIKVHLFFMNYFTQSSVMIRKSCLLQKIYHKEMEPAEDYHLWIRLSLNYKLWNLPQTLTAYRIHETNITKTNLIELKRGFSLIIASNLNNLKLVYNTDELNVHLNILKGERPVDFKDLIGRLRWLQKLNASNKKTGVYNDQKFTNYVKMYWINSFVSIRKFNPRLILFLFHPYSFNLTKQYGLFSMIKLVIKSIIFYKLKESRENF
jgi:glycosyltransferase involved in cell wall biosynthesis